jgi:hypothetical protein
MLRSFVLSDYSRGGLNARLLLALFLPRSIHKLPDSDDAVQIYLNNLPNSLLGYSGLEKVENKYVL